MSSGTILIIDDEPQIRRVLRTTLSVQGYEVQDARSGEEALDRLREDHFDLLLLDVNMPGMGGLEACREIRASSDVAIMMLTVRSEEADKVAALDAGADDYVTKPFSMPELLARIRAAMRRLPVPPASGAQIINLEGVEINFATRRVKTKTQGNPPYSQGVRSVELLDRQPGCPDSARKAAASSVGSRLWQ